MNGMNQMDYELERQVGPVLFQQLKANQRSFFWIGISLMILGSAAVIFAVASTAIVMIYFGLFLALLGCLEVAKAFNMRLWREYFFLHLFLGVLFALAGLFMVFNPIENAIMLTLVWALFFIVAGVMRIATALMYHVPHKGFLLINGVINLVLGLLIYAQWPASGLWVIGMFVGIDVLFAGLSLVMLSSMLKDR